MGSKSGFSAADSTGRLHSLDSLRACMMLLGIVLHTFNGYVDFPVGRVADARTSQAFDFGYLFLHLFRMPVFFVMSGFFASLLIDRRGIRDFIKNRSGRIVVPFAIAWLPLFILVWNSAAFLARQADAKLAHPGGEIHLTRFIRDDGLIHLWFLYYLIFYYAVVGVAAMACRKLPDFWKQAIRTKVIRWAPSLWACVFLSLLAFPAMFSMPLGILEPPLSFIPSASVLYFYGLFFTFGALLYCRRDLLPAFQKWAWFRLIAGLAIVPFNFAAVRLQGDLLSTDLRARAVAAATGALAIWLITTALLGLFYRYASASSPVMRYLTDSSYWLYLVHVPLVNYLGGLLAHSSLPLYLRASLTMAIIVPLLLVSYDYLVRPTVIGKTLNGRKYRRGLPEVEVKSAAVAA